eukprot:m.181984 g.181984  ORF g.181984 m.181984 type:complete len:160 (-) comp14970_c0_seq1:669-1148(-)
MALRAVGALGRVGHASRVVRCASRRTAHTARMPMQNRRVLLGCARWVSTPTHLQDESSDPAFATENDVEFVVRNLLYNHPDPEDLPEDPEGQVLSVLVEDEPGVSAVHNLERFSRIQRSTFGPQPSVRYSLGWHRCCLAADTTSSPCLSHPQTSVGSLE